MGGGWDWVFCQYGLQYAISLAPYVTNLITSSSCTRKPWAHCLHLSLVRWLPSFLLEETSLCPQTDMMGAAIKYCVCPRCLLSEHLCSLIENRVNQVTANDSATLGVGVLSGQGSFKKPAQTLLRVEKKNAAGTTFMYPCTCEAVARGLRRDRTAAPLV